MNVIALDKNWHTKHRVWFWKGMIFNCFSSFHVYNQKDCRNIAGLADLSTCGEAWHDQALFSWVDIPIFLVFPCGSQKKVKVYSSFGTQRSYPPMAGLGSIRNSRRYVVPMLTPNNLKQVSVFQNWESKNRQTFIETFLLILNICMYVYIYIRIINDWCPWFFGHLHIQISAQIDQDRKCVPWEGHSQAVRVCNLCFAFKVSFCCAHIFMSAVFPPWFGKQGETKQECKPWQCLATTWIEKVNKLSCTHIYLVNLQWHQCEFSILNARCPQIPKHPVCESKVLASAQHGSAMIISIRCPKIHQIRYVGALGKVCVPVVDMKNLTLQQLLGAGLEQFLEMEKLNTFEGWFLQFLLRAWVPFFGKDKTSASERSWHQYLLTNADCGMWIRDDFEIQNSIQLRVEKYWRYYLSIQSM